MFSPGPLETHTSSGAKPHGTEAELRELKLLTASARAAVSKYRPSDETQAGRGKAKLCESG